MDKMLPTSRCKGSGRMDASPIFKVVRLMEGAKVYSKSSCPWCDKAKALLDHKGIAYVEIDIEADPSAKEMLKDKGLKTVPQVWFGATHIGGYDDLSKQLNK